MVFSFLDAFTQFLIEDVLPVMSTPLFWSIVSVLCLLIALRRMFFPCMTLRGLGQAVAGVDQLFKEFQMDPFMYSQKLPTHSVNARCIMEYEEELLRIKKDLIDISLRDYASSWKKYMSLSRVWAISSLYKKTRRMQDKIEHLRTRRLQQHNSWNLRVVLLRRRHSLDADDQFELTG